MLVNVSAASNILSSSSDSAVSTFVGRVAKRLRLDKPRLSRSPE